MHILIIAAGKRTEHWTDMFNALCAEPGVRVTVLVADVSAATVRELLIIGARRPNLQFHVVPHLLGEDRTGHMASILFRPGRLRRLAGPRPDVIHIIGEASYLTTWQVTRLRRYWPDIPLTLYAAQNVVMRLPQPFPVLEQRAYRAVDHAFPITPAAQNVLRAKGYRGPATIIPLGVDTDLFRPAPYARERFTAGFVGRFEVHKGIGVLLEAAERIDCDLLLVGEGSQRVEVLRAAARRPGRITVYGWTGHAELPAILNRMDALVLPSVELVQRNLVSWIGIPLREQFGRVLVEGMACGVPVIGSEVGEIPYVIGPAGLTFPAGDAVVLADRLARIREDPALARLLADRGVLRADTEFGWDRAAAAMCRVWARLAGRSRRSDAIPPTSTPDTVRRAYQGAMLP